MWMQLRGKTTTPFNEWAIGYGALFIMLSLLSEAVPQGAGMFAALIVVADFLKNGEGLFKDVTGAISGAASGQSVFTSNPFSGSTSGASFGTNAAGASTVTAANEHPGAGRGVYNPSPSTLAGNLPGVTAPAGAL